MATAADYYYGKDVKDIKLNEAAVIAGLPQSPNNYNPFKHPEAAEKRRNIVLSLMAQHGRITEKQKEEAQKIPITEGLVSEKDPSHDRIVSGILCGITRGSSLLKRR